MSKKNKKRSTKEKKIIAFSTLTLSVLGSIWVYNELELGISGGLGWFLFLSLLFGFFISNWRNLKHWDLDMR